ncbi:MAG TPA: RluA family pseudouridine synthase [Pyrinomonadaceae bacterium]
MSGGGAQESKPEERAAQADSDEEQQEAPILTFEIAGGEAGSRLDAYLAAQVGGWSRSRIKRLIEDGDVLVAGHREKPSYKLRAGDRVEVELVAPPPSEFLPENIPLEIVHEDAEVVVVNKQAGQVVHPAAGISSGTLANALAFHFKQLSHSGRSIRPGIVHRLDRDTSGLIVVAKTEAAHENLTDQFRARTVFKSYVALVHGRFEQESGRIEGAIARDPRNRTRMAVVAGGRPALSLYRVRRRYDRFTLLDVEIKTGRTHQIRVHMEWLKHPVVGDAVYGGGRDKTVPDRVLRARINSLGRQFLHAEQLGFRHPRTGAELRFRAPLPAPLAALLDELS